MSPSMSATEARSRSRRAACDVRSPPDASLNRHDFTLNWNAALEAGGFSSRQRS